MTSEPPSKAAIVHLSYDGNDQELRARRSYFQRSPSDDGGQQGKRRRRRSSYMGDLNPTEGRSVSALSFISTVVSNLATASSWRMGTIREHAELS